MRNPFVIWIKKLKWHALLTSEFDGVAVLRFFVLIALSPFGTNASSIAFLCFFIEVWSILRRPFRSLTYLSWFHSRWQELTLYCFIDTESHNSSMQYARRTNDDPPQRRYEGSSAKSPMTIDSENEQYFSGDSVSLVASSDDDENDNSTPSNLQGLMHHVIIAFSYLLYWRILISVLLVISLTSQANIVHWKDPRDQSTNARYQCQNCWINWHVTPSST